MNRLLQPGFRRGKVTIPASKSLSHRALICAALSETPTDIICIGQCADIIATISCLNSLGADIKTDGDIIHVCPIKNARKCECACGESGSTLRFLIAVAGALGADTTFLMEGRLPERPLAPYDSELQKHGMKLTRDGALLHCTGSLQPGDYTISGSVSSQYISGLLMALPLLSGDSTLTVSGKLESADYVALTLDMLRRAGAVIDTVDNIYHIHGQHFYHMPPEITIESDFSNAAFFLCIGALSPDGVTVSGLDMNSLQGDRRIIDILRSFGAEIITDQNSFFVRRGKLTGQTIDAAMIPDLIPTLSVVAAAASGETRIINAERLRLKESDRLESTTAMLRTIGADISQTSDGLIIHGGNPLSGGTVDTFNDHRIAMSAAVASCICSAPVEVKGSECVGKSYPEFWNDFLSLEAAK